MNNIPEKKLSELNCSFISGYAFKSAWYANQGIPLIKIGNIQNRDVEIDVNGNYIPELHLTEKLNKYFLNDGDVLIAMTGQGSVGRVGKLKIKKGQKALLNQRVGKFVCNEKDLNLDYLYHILTTEKYQEFLFNTGAGSGQPNLSPELILDTPIPYFEYNEQKAIASVLSSLDDKIDLLHQQNQTLEALAETLFRQWFIEEAKEDWEEVKLKTVVDIAIGRTPPRKESQWFSTNNQDVKWISIKDLGSEAAFIFNTSEYLTNEAVVKFNIPIIPKDTVLLSFK